MADPMKGIDTRTIDPCPLEPLNGAVIVREDKPDEKTPGGVILPRGVDRVVQSGVIVAVSDSGTDFRHDLMRPDGQSDAIWRDGALKVGDRVFYSKGMAACIEIKGVEYLVMPAAGLLARQSA